MSHGVYSTNQDATVLLDPAAVKLEPVLGQLNQKQLLYIIWVYDYIRSPLRSKPIEDRRSLARNKFFPTLELDFENTPIITAAINSFKGLIYDEKKETIDAYRSKIVALQNNLRTEDTTSGIVNITKMIDILREKIDKLERDVYEEELIVQVKGNRELSFIEIWQRKRKHFKQSQMGS